MHLDRYSYMCIDYGYSYTDDTITTDFYIIYVKPWTRCPVYFMGILVGYYMHKTGGKVTMPKVHDMLLEHHTAIVVSIKTYVL